jgi:hypothetical protein
MRLMALDTLELEDLQDSIPVSLNENSMKTKRIPALVERIKACCGWMG